MVQHVDVCMFSNGKFKNVVALITSKGECPIGPSCSVNKTYMLNPAKGATKNWIALEDSYSKANAALASTVVCNSPEERNVFAIYVSYYVKVKLLVGAIGGELSLKLPFTLMHSPSSAPPLTTELAAESPQTKPSTTATPPPSSPLLRPTTIESTTARIETPKTTPIATRMAAQEYQDPDIILKCDENNQPVDT